MVVMICGVSHVFDIPTPPSTLGRLSTTDCPPKAPSKSNLSPIAQTTLIT